MPMLEGIHGGVAEDRRCECVTGGVIRCFSMDLVSEFTLDAAT